MKKKMEDFSLPQERHDSYQWHAEVEVVAAIALGEVHGDEPSPVVDDGRAAGARHRRDAIGDALAVGLLRDGAAGKLCVDAIVGLGQGHAVVVAYHVDRLVDFELVVESGQ